METEPLVTLPLNEAIPIHISRRDLLDDLEGLMQHLYAQEVSIKQVAKQKEMQRVEVRPGKTNRAREAKRQAVLKKRMQKAKNITHVIEIIEVAISILVLWLAISAWGFIALLLIPFLFLFFGGINLLISHIHASGIDR